MTNILTHPIHFRHLTNEHNDRLAMSIKRGNHFKDKNMAKHGFESSQRISFALHSANVHLLDDLEH